MKLKRYTALAGRLLPLALALLVMGAAPSAKAQIRINGIMGADAESDNYPTPCPCPCPCPATRQ